MAKVMRTFYQRHDLYIFLLKGDFLHDSKDKSVEISVRVITNDGPIAEVRAKLES